MYGYNLLLISASFFDFRLRKWPRTTISLVSKWPPEQELFKKMDFDQNILEVTIVKNFEKWLVYSFKMTSLGHVALFDKTTIFCSIGSKPR